MVNSASSRVSTPCAPTSPVNGRSPRPVPGSAKREDVEGLPPTVISVNECDPLRDEGIAFYRLLMSSGVSARCRQMMGACHGLELLPAICPDIAHSTASDIADFTIGWAKP